MKARLAGLVLLLGLFAIVVSRGAGPGPATLPTPVSRAAPVSEARPSEPPEARAFDASDRDPFRYADDDAPTPAADAGLPEPRPVDPEPTLATPAPLRLVGLVQRGPRLHAALVVSGEVTLVAVGDEIQGLRVLAVDEEAGVRLEDPDGNDTLLPPPS